MNENQVEFAVLNAFEQDALKELFNIGIGRAADALSQMVQDEIQLSVPILAVYSKAEAIRQLKERVSDNPATIRQHFSGAFSGAAFLIYPESSSLELVYSLLGEETPLESLTELEQESLLEVGNIILNACLGSFANIMDLEFTFDLPEYFKGDFSLFFSPGAGNSPTTSAHEHVVFLIVDFRTGERTRRQHVIKGFVILLLTMEAMQDLRRELNLRFGGLELP